MKYEGCLAVLMATLYNVKDNVAFGEFAFDRGQVQYEAWCKRLRACKDIASAQELLDEADKFVHPNILSTKRK